MGMCDLELLDVLMHFFYTVMVNFYKVLHFRITQASLLL